ncbi:MAG: LDCC motif putative metal-binding protein [Bacteroidota bacterium]
MKWWENFLRKIAAANQEQYGNRAPSCCQGQKKPAAAVTDKKNTGGKR